MHRPAHALAAALLVLAAAVPVSGASVPDFSDEIRFRQLLGFSTDPALLLMLASNPMARSEDHPIPLTDAEATELDRRIFVQEHKDPLKAYLMSQPMTYAGLWTDHVGGGTMIIQFTEGMESHRSRIEALAPAGAILELRRVTYSLESLRELRDQILSDADALRSEFGVEIQALGFSVPLNRIELGVSGSSPSSLQGIQARYGADRLWIYQSQGGQHTACSTRSNCPGPPLRAGIRGSYGCSIAFMAKRNAAWYLFTAGHCSDNGATWSHPSVPPKGLGAMSQDSYFDGSDADAALLGPLGSTDRSRWVYRTYNSTIPMFSVQTVTGDDFNDLVCLSARIVEAVRCGTIIDTEFTINYSPDGSHTMVRQRRANYDWRSGDSGGAVYYSSQAMGIQSGCLDTTGDDICEPFEAVYSHIGYAQSRTGGIVNTTDCGLYC